jgi:probable HAF family extracellular repeat protein
MKTKFSVITALLVLFGMSTASSVQYSITDLGTLESDPESKAFGINDDGQVVGYSGTVQGPEAGRRAFLWDNGTMLNLGTLGGNHSEAYGINNSGQVVGRSTLPTGEADVRGFLWENGSIIDLGTLAEGWTEAHGINNASQVVGYSVLLSSVKAFLWENGSMANLGSLGDNSRGYANNDSGQIAGYCFGWGACLWQNGTITSLGTLGGNNSYAWDINNYGQIVGSSSTGGVVSYTHAFLWENGTMTDLGTLGGNWSEAYGINDAAQIVGRSGGRAFLWENGTMINLNEFLSSRSGWVVLYEATGINNIGQIVGTGTIDSGECHAFLMTPVIYVEIEIRPNTLNFASRGKWINCEIWLPEDYNVADVNSHTVFLEDEVQAEWIWFNEKQSVVMAKFNRAALRQILQPGEVELTVSGHFLDGTYFLGTDTIKVINKGRKNK